MKLTFSVITLLLFSFCSLGQTIQRLENETDTAFIKRLIPDSMTLAHPVISTTTFNSTKVAILAFFGYDDPKDENDGDNAIFGHLYLPTGKNTYQDYTFGPIEEEGGYPEIIAVFFANTDKDKAKELLVLCKYPQQHNDYSGDFFKTFIFESPVAGQQTLAYKDQLSEKFFGCQCGWNNGKKEVAKYKTAKSIKNRLKKMGFK